MSLKGQISQTLQKFRHFKNIWKQHGGLKGVYLNLYRTDELKWGNEVGVDKYGNKYFENKLYMMGRSRWVQYSDQYGMDYDGSQVPAEWHRWLSYIGDDTPIKSPPVKYSWMIDHKENLSGTNSEYVPYSTTRPKIEAWKPPQKS